MHRGARGRGRGFGGRGAHFSSDAKREHSFPPVSRGGFARGRGRGFRGGGHAAVSQSYRPQVVNQRLPEGVTRAGRDVVVLLEHAGLMAGNMGLVDAYDRAASTEIANESLRDVRPDIVHQCLLALFDSGLAQQHRLRVYINLFARSGRVIEVSPSLRPPRTYGRFRGLMSVLLRDGKVCSATGEVLMQMMPGSVAPVIPHGAEVVGLTNLATVPVTTAMQLARAARADPVPDSLQGGVKNVEAFYSISCTEDGNLEGVDYVTRTVCLSAYPITPHIMCARICEAHERAF